MRTCSDTLCRPVHASPPPCPHPPQVLKPVQDLEGEGVIEVTDESPLQLYDFPTGVWPW